MVAETILATIIFLAMLAGFIALRLVSVLGKRTGHENPVGESYGRRPAELAQPTGAHADVRMPVALDMPEGISPELRAPLQDIAQVEPGFEPRRFLEGARAAYGMILKAFWDGKADELDALVSDDVAMQFRRAIEMRQAEGLTLENRLLRIERAQIVSVHVAGRMAEITVRFDADLVALTRNRQGEVVAGSMSDAVDTHDVWTFSRHLGAQDPNWLLIATDAQG